MSSIAQRWGCWYQRRFQNTERGRHFSKTLLAARSRSGGNERTRQSSRGTWPLGRGLLTHGPAPPFHSRGCTSFAHTPAHLPPPSPCPLGRGRSLPTCPHSHPINVLPSLPSASLFSAAASILSDLRQNVSPSAPHQCSRPLRSGSSSDWAAQGVSVGN